MDVSEGAVQMSQDEVEAEFAALLVERDRARTGLADAKATLRSIAEPDDLLDANEQAFGGHAARRMQAQAQAALSRLDSEREERATT